MLSKIKYMPKKLINYYTNMNIALKASIWFAICSIVQKGISIITMPIFTRIMSTDQYGTYSIFLTWYNIMLLIITLNIHSEVFNKGLIEHSENMDEFASNQAGLLVVLITIFSAIYAVFYQFFNNVLNLSTPLILVMIAEIWANAMLGFWYSQKRFEFQYMKIVKITIAIAILTPIIGIIAVLTVNEKAEARIITNAIIPICISIVLFIKYIKKGKLFSNFNWWKKAIKLSVPLLPHYLSLILLNQSDKLMINHFSGTTNAAIYSVAHSAGLLMTIINTSINNSFVPWCYSKLKGNDIKGIKQTSNNLLVIVLIVNILLIWIAPEAIKLLAAKEYFSATWCLVPIAMSVYFFFAYTLFVDVEIYYEKNHYVAIASVLATCINIILNFIFIPKYGFLVAGYTTLISYLFTMILHYIFLKKILKSNNKKISDLFDIKTITIFSAILVICSLVAMMLYNLPLIRLSLVFGTIIIIFVKRDKIIGILKKIKRKRNN